MAWSPDPAPPAPGFSGDPSPSSPHSEDAAPSATILYHDFEVDSGVSYHGTTAVRSSEDPYEGVFHLKVIEGNVGQTGFIRIPAFPHVGGADSFPVIRNASIEISMWVKRTGLGNTRMELFIVWDQTNPAETIESSFIPPSGVRTKYTKTIPDIGDHTEMELLVATDHDGVVIGDDIWSIDNILVRNIPWKDALENTSPYTPDPV